MKNSPEVSAFLDELPSERQEAIRTLHELFVKALPLLKVSVTQMMSLKLLSYGLFHYTYASGRQGDASPVSIANNKQYISVYIMGGEGEWYLAEKNAKRLGPKVSVGKSCIRFKKLEDVDLDVLVELAQEAARQHPQDSDWIQPPR